MSRDWPFLPCSRICQTFVINHLARANNEASADSARRIRVGAAQMV